MTKEVASSLPCEIAAIPSSQYVRSYPVCNCGKRWTCVDCRESWIRRRQRTSEKWLNSALANGGKAWFALLSIPTAGAWLTEAGELWQRWRRLGRQRSLHRQRRTPGELSTIDRGIAAMHMVNKQGRWQPHLHAVIVTSAQFDADKIIDQWQALGPGFADIERVESLGAVIRYSIAGPIPESPGELAALSEWLAGVRMVRRIGR